MTKKNILVPFISENLKMAADISPLFDRISLPYQPINEVDWAEEYPYAPSAEFRLAYSDEALLIDYRVTENGVRAVEQEDGGHVWEDSCCEFFSSPVDDGTYYNIECNCVGTLLIAHGSGRNNREMASKNIMDQVQRWSSFGREAFGSRSGVTSWKLSLIIPFFVYFKHNGVHSTNLKANFYKCGDNLPQPHFLSWNRIETETPDFHRPEFFGDLLLK